MTTPTGGAAGRLAGAIVATTLLLAGCGGGGAPDAPRPVPPYLPLPASDYVVVGNAYVQTRWITHVMAEADGNFTVNWRIGSGYGAKRTATELERAHIRAHLGIGPIFYDQRTGLPIPLPIAEEGR